MKRGSWAARVAIFSGGILGVAAFFLVVVRSLDITVAGVEPEALVLTGVMTAPFTLGVSCCWCWERPPLSGWFVGPGPRNSDGNPDSSQAVVFLTSTIDVIVNLANVFHTLSCRIRLSYA